MAQNRVKIKQSGFRTLAKSPEMRRLLEGYASQVEQRAKSNAIVKDGTYRNSIQSEIIEHPDRLVGRVKATAPHALKVEARTGNLSRALDAVRE